MSSDFWRPTPNLLCLFVFLMRLSALSTSADPESRKTASCTPCTSICKITLWEKLYIILYFVIYNLKRFLDFHLEIHINSQNFGPTRPSTASKLPNSSVRFGAAKKLREIARKGLITTRTPGTIRSGRRDGILYFDFFILINNVWKTREQKFKTNHKTKIERLWVGA